MKVGIFILNQFGFVCNDKVSILVCMNLESCLMEWGGARPDFEGIVGYSGADETYMLGWVSPTNSGSFLLHSFKTCMFHVNFS